MELNRDFIADVELLNLFTLDSSQVGLKVHHTAAPERTASAKRLFDMRLTTQVDGGYLTPLGLKAAEHAQALVRILRSESSPITAS